MAKDTHSLMTSNDQRSVHLNTALNADIYAEGIYLHYKYDAQFLEPKFYFCCMAHVCKACAGQSRKYFLLPYGSTRRHRMQRCAFVAGPYRLEVENLVELGLER